MHQALRYDSDVDFLTATTGFVHAGLNAGDTVLALVSTRNLTLLGDALGDRSREVELADARLPGLVRSRTFGRGPAVGQPAAGTVNS